MSNGELGRGLVRVEKALGVLTTEIREQRSEYVHRTEWDLARSQVEHRFEQDSERISAVAATAKEDVGRVEGALATLAESIDHRRPQWTAIVSAIVAAIALALTLFSWAPH